LRQPIFEPLSDVLIASRQMNPRLVMLLRELASFSSIRPSVRMRAKIKRSHRYRGHSIRSAEDRCNIRLQVRIIGAVFGFFRLVTPKARRVFREAGTGIEPVSSGFADRGLTTWLPRQTRPTDLNCWLSFLFRLSLPIFRDDANDGSTIARYPGQRKQGVQLLSEG
jgi:hypothetical protein